MNKPEERICTGCGKEKPASDFNPHGGSGVLRCKACQQAAGMETRRKGGRAALSASPEVVLEAARKPKRGRPRKHTPTLLLIDQEARVVRFFVVTEVWTAPLDGDLKASIAAAPMPLVADYAAQRVQPRPRRKP